MLDWFIPLTMSNGFAMRLEDRATPRTGNSFFNVGHNSVVLQRYQLRPIFSKQFGPTEKGPTRNATLMCGKSELGVTTDVKSRLANDLFGDRDYMTCSGKLERADLRFQFSVTHGILVQWRLRTQAQTITTPSHQKKS